MPIFPFFYQQNVEMYMEQLHESCTVAITSFAAPLCQWYFMFYDPISDVWVDCHMPLTPHWYYIRTSTGIIDHWSLTTHNRLYCMSSTPHQDAAWCDSVLFYTMLPKFYFAAVKEIIQSNECSIHRLLLLVTRSETPVAVHCVFPLRRWCALAFDFWRQCRRIDVINDYELIRSPVTYRWRHIQCSPPLFACLWFDGRQQLMFWVLRGVHFFRRTENWWLIDTTILCECFTL